MRKKGATTIRDAATARAGCRCPRGWISVQRALWAALRGGSGIVSSAAGEAGGQGVVPQERRQCATPPVPARITHQDRERLGCP